MTRVALLLFAKYPQAGSVKTRMTPPLTPQEAADLHRSSLQCTLEALPLLSALDVHLVITPDQRLNVFREQFGSWVSKVWAQGVGDLGQRLVGAMERAFADGNSRVLFLGADSPTLPTQLLLDAIDRLSAFDVVLGPCDDGGYYLIGMKRSVPEVFRDIRWGGAEVAAQTKDRAEQAGLSLSELPTWYDLDRFEDLKRARIDLADSDAPPSSARCRLKEMVNALLEKYSDERSDDVVS